MFIEELEKNSLVKNTKGGLYYSSSFNSNLNLFALSSRYTDKEKLKSLFNNAYFEDKDLATANLLFLLDIRNGKGERRIFKTLFKKLCLLDQERASKVLKLIPELGRYDYIFETFNTPLWSDCVQMTKEQLDKDLISDNPSLLAKWMPSLRTHNVNNVVAKQLALSLFTNEKEYRKTLSFLRSKLDIVEKHISNKDFNIAYENVPSKAMLKYQALFMKKDGKNYASYLSSLDKKEKKVNASILEPYEMVHALLTHSKNKTLINNMWNSQKNVLKGDFSNVLVVCDTSGSMENFNQLPLSCALGLSIYLASHNHGVFHNKFLNFSTNPSLQTLLGNSLSMYIDSIDRSNWSETTRIDKALDLILQSTINNVEDAPSHLLIVSDMEFDSACKNKTNFSSWKKKYNKAKIQMPKIIFWNVACQTYGLPVTKYEDDVIMVSGFSKNIFRNIFNIEEYKPFLAMKEILNPYLEMLKE